MNSVVTGAAGFIGSHVVDALLLRGDGVRALVRGSGRPIPWHAQGAEVVVGDLRDADTARAAVHGAHTVYHCAAAGDNVSRQELHDTNVGGLRNLLEAMRRSDARRLVLMSGLSVLGLRNCERMTEELPTCPCRDPEIQAKLEAEALAWEYQRAHGIEVSILRAGFVYGPRDRRNLPQLLDAVRKWTFIYIGSRRNVVPLVHVSDMAAALLLAGVIPQANGRVYHIADGSRTTIRDLVRRLAELLGRSPPFWWLPYYPTYVTCAACEWLGRVIGWPRQGPISRSTLLFLGTSRYVDIRRAKEELGFSPGIGYREGLAEAFRSIEEGKREDLALQEGLQKRIPTGNL